MNSSSWAKFTKKQLIGKIACFDSRIRLYVGIYNSRAHFVFEPVRWKQMSTAEPQKQEATNRTWIPMNFTFSWTLIVFFR